MIYYDWEVIEVRKRRWPGGQGGICLPFLYNKLVSLPVGEGRKKALKGTTIKTGWHCLSLSLLTDSQLMCISDERSLLQENKYFITIIWTQSCLLLSDDVCMKEIATTIWCQKVGFLGRDFWT